MKKLSLLSLLLAGLLLFSSCDKGEMGPVISNDPGSPEMTAPESGQSYTLLEDQANDTLVTFEWNHADYGFSAAPDISLEMVETGNDFTDPMQLASTNGTSYSITVEDMNENLLGLGFTPLQEYNLDFRVKASLNDTTQVSESITLNITPYSTCEYCPAIYAPGSYQAASNEGNNWDPGTAPELVSVDGLTDMYEGYVYMANANNEFKFSANRNWSKDWGTDGTENGLVDSDQEGNILQAEAGYYKINVNINRLQYSMTKTDWGLVGDATGSWETDQDMTYDPNNKVWTITTDLSAGAIKFRANDAWNIEYGDDEGDGELDSGGGNISISSAGNYTITLDLSSSPYTYSVSQN